MGVIFPPSLCCCSSQTPSITNSILFHHPFLRCTYGLSTVSTVHMYLFYETWTKYSFQTFHWRIFFVSFKREKNMTFAQKAFISSFFSFLSKFSFSFFLASRLFIEKLPVNPLSPPPPPFLPTSYYAMFIPKKLYCRIVCPWKCEEKGSTKKSSSSSLFLPSKHTLPSWVSVKKITTRHSRMCKHRKYENTYCSICS